MRTWKHCLRCRCLDETWYKGPIHFWLLTQACKCGPRRKEIGNFRVEYLTPSFTTSPMTSWSRKPAPLFFHSPNLPFHSLHTHTHPYTLSCLHLSLWLHKRRFRQRLWRVLFGGTWDWWDWAVGQSSSPTKTTCGQNSKGYNLGNPSYR